MMKKVMLDLDRELFDVFYSLVGKDEQTCFAVVEEECSEVIKEICKIRRGKGNTDLVCEELCDVIASGLSYMHQHNYSFAKASEYINGKYRRAIDRFKNGQIS